MATSWPRSRQTNRQNSQNERTSGANTPTRDGGRQQAAAALSGNAWTQPKGKATGGGGAPQSPVQAADSHVPVQDFNAAEVKNFLKKSTFTSYVPADGSYDQLSISFTQANACLLGYLESIGGVAPSDTSVVNNASNPTSPKDQSSIFHKVQGDSVKRSSGAWGSRGITHPLANVEYKLTSKQATCRT
jgi:hypothetical protein